MEGGVVRNLRNTRLATGDNVVDLATYQSAQMPTRLVMTMYRKVMGDTKSENYALLQSTGTNGHHRLVEIVAKMYSKLINRHIDPYTEVLTTLGLKHALSCALLGILECNVEVIVMEPFVESYVRLIVAAGALPRFAPFKKLYNNSTKSYEFFLDDKEFESLFSENTKAVILNNPNSVTGKVFSLFELNMIAELCIRWNVICISDEVYEWQVYEPRSHFRIASLPGMWERTVTVGSGAQNFGVTGWAVAWIYGPQSLMSYLNVMYYMTVRSGSTLMEEIVARLLEKEFGVLGKEASQFKLMNRQMERKRNFLFEVLKMVKFEPILPWAGDFIMVDWSSLEVEVDLNSETGVYDDFRFVEWLAKNVGVRGTPVTPSYPPSHKKVMEHYIRLSFVTNISNLKRAKKKLMDAFLKKNKNCLSLDDDE